MTKPTFGDRVLAALQSLADDARAGRPVRQSIVRRMRVKGKTVVARETFKAPLKGRKE